MPLRGGSASFALSLPKGDLSIPLQGSGCQLRWHSYQRKPNTRLAVG